MCGSPCTWLDLAVDGFPETSRGCNQPLVTPVKHHCQASSSKTPNDLNIENNLNLNVVSCEALKLVSTRQFTYYFILLFMYRQMLSESWFVSC